jgi:hypothetical protein
MAAALPVLKLAGLLIKTVTKPFANQISSRAKTNAALGEKCAAVGQFIHRTMTRVSVVSQGYKFVGTKPLPTEEAVSKGAGFVSETIIFSIAGAVTTFEYLRSEREKAEKEKVKSQKAGAEKAELMGRIETMENKIAALELGHATAQQSRGWWFG